MECGELFVMICGVLWMQACPAGSWDFLQVVSVFFMWLSLFQKKKTSVASYCYLYGRAMFNV